MIIRERIRMFRRRKNLSQRDLAELTGLSQSSISAIEAGKNKDVKQEQIDKICKALGITEGDLSDKPDWDNPDLRRIGREIPPEAVDHLVKAIEAIKRNKHHSVAALANIAALMVSSIFVCF